MWPGVQGPGMKLPMRKGLLLRGLFPSRGIYENDQKLAIINLAW